MTHPANIILSQSWGLESIVSGLTLLGLELGGVLVKHMESARQEACIYLWSRIAIIGDRGKISFFRNKWVCVLKLRKRWKRLQTRLVCV